MRLLQWTWDARGEAYCSSGHGSCAGELAEGNYRHNRRGDSESGGGDWIQIFQGPLTVDLLELPTVTHQLGPVEIPSGAVTQVRFVLDPNGPQYVVLPDGSHASLKTPSGDTSGLKLNGPFQVQACETHVLVLDFDGPNAIEYHQTGGPSGEWILRPVIQVRSEFDQGGACLPPNAGSDVGN